MALKLQVIQESSGMSIKTRNPMNWELDSKSKYCKPRKLEIGTKIQNLLEIQHSKA